MWQNYRSTSFQIYSYYGHCISDNCRQQNSTRNYLDLFITWFCAFQFQFVVWNISTAKSFRICFFLPIKSIDLIYTNSDNELNNLITMLHNTMAVELSLIIFQAGAESA